MTSASKTANLTIGTPVRASYPYGGVPACQGTIIKELILGRLTQFLVRFEVRPGVFKNYYLTERELTLCPEQTSQDA